MYIGTGGVPVYIRFNTQSFQEISVEYKLNGSNFINAVLSTALLKAIQNITKPVCSIVGR